MPFGRYIFRVSGNPTSCAKRRQTFRLVSQLDLTFARTRLRVTFTHTPTDLRGYCLPRQPSEVVVGPPDPARVGGEYVKSESTGLQRWVNRGIDPTVVKHQDQSSKVNNDINNANDSRAKQRVSNCWSTRT